MTGCPYDGKCPHIECLRNDLIRYQEENREETKEMRKTLCEMRKTLYIIAGILFAELGVMII